MAYVVNGIVYVPVQVSAPATVQFTQSTDTSSLIKQTSTSTQTTGLRKAVDISDNQFLILGHIQHNYPSLQCRIVEWGRCFQQRAVEIVRMHSDLPPEKGGPMTLANIVIFPDMSAKFRVAGEDLECTEFLKENNLCWKTISDFLDLLSDTHAFCAGIQKEEFKSVCSGIRYEPQCLVLKTFPFERYIGKACKRWYKLRKNANIQERRAVEMGDARCIACNKAYRGVRHRNKSQLPKLTQQHRDERTSASSRYPWSLLSPRGMKRKRESVNLERRKKIKQIANLSDRLKRFEEIELEDEQSEALSTFVHQVSGEDLNAALQAENDDNAAALKAAFLHDQERNSK